MLSPLHHPCTPVCLVKLQVILFLSSPLDTEVLFSENKGETKFGINKLKKFISVKLHHNKNDKGNVLRLGPSSQQIEE